MLLNTPTTLNERIFAMSCLCDSGARSSDDSLTDDASGAKRLRVIVADDERRVADSVKDILLDSGHVAVAAYDGFSALNIAKESCPECPPLRCLDAEHERGRYRGSCSRDLSQCACSVIFGACLCIRRCESCQS